MGRYSVEEWVEARSAAERNEARQTDKAKKNDAGKHKKGKGKEKDITVQAGNDVLKMKEEEIEPLDSMAIDTDPTKKVVDGDRDPWDQVWKLTGQEIREAFLAINAVRWTQPVHLSGQLLSIYHSFYFILTSDDQQVR